MVVGILMLLHIGFNRIWHFIYIRVNDHPKGATHDRRNGAIFKWPKSGFRTGSKLAFFTPFQSVVFG